MLKDPRDLIDGYHHRFQGKLDLDYDSRLKQYDSFLMYTLERTENGCQVEVRLAKKNSHEENVTYLRDLVGTITIEDFAKLNTDEFLQKISEEIDGFFHVEDEYYDHLNSK